MLPKYNTVTVVGAGYKQFIVYIAIRRDEKTINANTLANKNMLV